MTYATLPDGTEIPSSVKGATMAVVTRGPGGIWGVDRFTVDQAAAEARRTFIRANHPAFEVLVVGLEETI